MVDNPNSVLQAAVHGKPMKSRMHIHITTQHTPIKGGGTANTEFLAAASNPPGGKANAAEVDATFWIETLPGSGGGGDISPTAVHAAGAARLQRPPLAPRHGSNATKATSPRACSQRQRDRRGRGWTAAVAEPRSRYGVVSPFAPAEAPSGSAVRGAARAGRCDARSASDS
jgi:hypothetical protein